ncbi:MAG TPA: serine hydrolase [Pirellulaceae bacterium]|nr:serine hydrolase [Pirellulaceae bacterium]
MSGRRSRIVSGLAPAFRLVALTSIATLFGPLVPPAHLAAQERSRDRAIAASDRTALIERCRRAAEYSEANDGHYVLVMVDGEVVFEQGVGRTTGTTPHLLASGTKSFSGVAAALAIDDGLLDLDEKVSDTITEWKQDPKKRDVTVRQLLSLAAGLESLKEKLDMPRNRQAAGITDCVAASLAARSVAEPGERFIYGPSSFYVFGELLKRKLAAAGHADETVATYLERKLFEPLDIKAHFLVDQAENPNLPGGGLMSARDWAVFGEMMRHGGEHEGRRLISEKSLNELTRAHGPNDRYGLTWWLLSPSGGRGSFDADGDGAGITGRGAGGTGPAAQGSGDDRRAAARRRIAEALRERVRQAGEARMDDTTTSPVPGFMAAGMGKQRLYVLPEAKMTIVRFGELNGSQTFSDREFLSTILDEGE